MTRLVFLDTETTGLDSDRHDVWEIGVIVRDDTWDDAEYRWLVPPNLSTADATGLRIGRFYERTPHLPAGFQGIGAYNLAEVWTEEDEDRSSYQEIGTRKVHDRWSHPSDVAETLSRLLDGAHIVGAVPDFDARFLTRFLRKHGQAPTWHYHLIDVEALTVGWLAGAGTSITPPWDSRSLAAVLGIQQSEDEKHTALGDARFCRDVYDRVMSS